jgi:hypothetical protein
MKDLCKSCEHLNIDGTRITITQEGTIFEPYRQCSFKNISLHNCNPLSSCDSYSVSELASPEDKYKALSLI